ncbi:hypothetical protein U1Q18_018889 [Sarracenia purpurea var. burkii]
MPEDFLGRKGPEPSQKVVDDLKMVSIKPIGSVGNNWPDHKERELIDFLIKNKEVFAWTPAGMCEVDTDMIVHQLAINTSVKPIVKKAAVQHVEDVAD